MTVEVTINWVCDNCKKVETSEGEDRLPTEWIRVKAFIAHFPKSTCKNPETGDTIDEMDMCPTCFRELSGEPVGPGKLNETPTGFLKNLFTKGLLKWT